MRWLIAVAVLLALLGVGAVFYLVLDPGRERAAMTRSERERATRAAEARIRDGETGDAAATDGFALDLRVVLPDGAAAEGALVELVPGDAAPADADAEGRVRVRAPHTGSYSLLARKGDAAASLRIDDLEADRDLGTLVLRKALTVSGRVFDSRQRPLGGAAVLAFKSPYPPERAFLRALETAGRRQAVSARAVTGADGAYRLSLPGDGYYTLRAEARGFVSSAGPQREIREDLTGIDFHLVPGLEVAGSVIEEGGRPVAGAWITLGGGGPFGNSSASSTTTGADGRFRLTSAWREYASITVRASGFQAHVDHRLRIPVKDTVITLEHGMSLRLRVVGEGTGAPLPGLDVILFGTGGLRTAKTGPDGVATIPNLELPAPGASARGRQAKLLVFVTGSGDYAPLELRREPVPAVDGVMEFGDVELSRGGVARGRVIEKDSGKPIPGAVVRYVGGVSFQAIGINPAHAVTDASGRFEFRGLPLEVSQLLAEHPDFVDPRDPRELFVALRGRGEPLFPDGLGDVEVEIRLEAASDVTGVVQAPGGEPVAGAEVSVVNRRFGLPFFSAGVNSVYTDAEGRFRISGFRRDASVQLTASHSLFGKADTQRGNAGSGVDVILRLRASLQVAGRVVDEAEAPVAGVRITLRAEKPNGPRSRFDRPATRSGMSDEEGRFLIRNAPGGSATITFDHRSYERETREISVTDSEGGLDLGDIVLSRGIAIHGVVVNDAGQPQADLSVNGTYVDERGNTGFPGALDAPVDRRWASATTDAEGRFALYGLMEGSYRLQVYGREIVSDRLTVTAGAIGVRIGIRSAVRLDLNLTAAGRPIEGAGVRAREPGLESGRAFLAWGRSDKQGDVTLYPIPPDKEVELEITHPAYKTSTLTGVRPTSRRLDVELDAGMSVSGMLRDFDGGAASGVSVSVWLGEERQRSAESDEKGRFEIGGLDPGPLELRVSAQSRGYLPVDALPVEAGQSGISVTLRRGETIRGSVVDGEGAPVRGLRVEALDGEGKIAARGYVWSTEGEFTLQALPAGSYTLRFLERTPDNEEVLKAELASVSTGTEDLKVTVDD